MQGKVTGWEACVCLLIEESKSGLNRVTSDLERMGLGVEDEFVLPTVFDLPDVILESKSVSLSIQESKLNRNTSTYRCLNEITILQHLGEQEALLII